MEEKNCERCNKPLVGERFKKEIFVEESLDIIIQPVLICSNCGKEHEDGDPFLLI